MRKLFLFIILIFLCLTVCSAQNQEESITITTYYPSPYGVYKNLRLYPTDEPTGSAVTEGLMYYDKDDHAVKYWNSTSWVDLTACWLGDHTDSSGKTNCPEGFYVSTVSSATPGGRVLCCKVQNPH